MKVEMKIWTKLGLATVLAGASLGGCAENSDTADSSHDAASTEMGEGGEGGETGETGESGEGGVSIDDASSDPVVFGSALAVAEAHAIAARDAFAAGNTDAAAEMFAHPVSEVLLDMDPVFSELGVADFKPLFTDASAAVLAGDSADAINARFQAIVAALRAAGSKAPSDGSSSASVSGGVIADQVERAVAMYREATSSDRYEPYLDGYGFFKAAQTAFEMSGSDIEAENPELHGSIAEALDLLASAYPSALRPETLEVDIRALTAASSRIELDR